ncbi:MAG: hypothetical protein EOT05_00405 [Candidatus Microsaccharimonas sossegonensis]|uniref:WxL domain-containing protein n=1 Tax=Candidatus Microsaccharimonas sossegonensis TaxID=2506948 RepID=A0A4Q0AHZ8_9BACT|nr:MAG: hypothetical protein EOT05_00405 [Candidatus Microsaccharimonas sossegonensis]
MRLLTKIKKLHFQLFAFFAICVVTFASFSSLASAAQVTNRTLTIGSSVASASTSYAFTFTAPSVTIIKSASFTACTTASGACTTPSGFSVSSATLASQPSGFGSGTGWTVNTATAGSLRIVNSSNATAPSGSQSVTFNSVTNQSAANATFFVRITTYSDAAWTTAIDTGTVAASTAGQITVTASVDETVTFTLGGATVPLGTLTTSGTGSGTSSMTASTNANSGYSITVNGTTLTSGSNTIAALTSPTASTVNTAQFGINLVANTAPSVGTGVSGTGSGTAATGYNTANQFKFVSGDTVASATTPTNSNTFTTSYIANINGATAAGSYATQLTYIATTNF